MNTLLLILYLLCLCYSVAFQEWNAAVGWINALLMLTIIIAKEGL